MRKALVRASGAAASSTIRPARSRRPIPRATPRPPICIANEAVRFIDAHKDQPFFAYLPFLAVHIPIGARQDLIEKYERKQASAPPDAWGHERDSKLRLVQNHPVYAAMVEQLDTAIGRVLAALDRNGLAGRTIVVFMSDNGGLATAEGCPTSNLPLRAGKGWLYEGGIREPWIISGPGRDQARQHLRYSSHQHRLLPDAPGTRRPAADAAAARRRREPCAVAERSGELKRGPLFWHYPHYGNQGGAPGGAVRDGDWKLIEWYEDGSRELFNLRDDLGEQKNVAAENPDRVKALAARLSAWRLEVHAIMPTPNPRFSR